MDKKSFKQMCFTILIVNVILVAINSYIGVVTNMEWWINVLINIFSSAVMSVIIIIVSYRKFLKDIPGNTKKEIDNLLNARLGYETTNHNAVLAALNPDNRNLSAEHTRLDNKINEVLILAKSENTKKDTLVGTELDILKTSYHISALVDLLAEQKTEIEKLAIENRQLKEQLLRNTQVNHQTYMQTQDDDEEYER